jgi:hypothetical protein
MGPGRTIRRPNRRSGIMGTVGSVTVGRATNSDGSGPMEKKWKLSQVELLEGGQLFGFALCDQRGKPCVSLGYRSEEEANAGHDHVVAALKGVEEVLGC